MGTSEAFFEGQRAAPPYFTGRVSAAVQLVGRLPFGEDAEGVVTIPAGVILEAKALTQPANIRLRPADPPLTAASGYLILASQAAWRPKRR